MFPLCSINADEAAMIGGKARRQGDGQGAALWSLGLACGFAAGAAGQALLLPFAATLAAAGGLGLGGLALARLLRPRPRAVVWQEPAWGG
jgi:hypothetical protein